MQFNARFVKSGNLGRIVVRSSSLFAQSGSANSPHSQRDIVRFIPKNYRFIFDFISILFYHQFQCALSSEYFTFLSYLLRALV